MPSRFRSEERDAARRMVATRIITALCTPLADEDSLHRDGLETHLEQQWRSGISGVLVAGSMGQMQLLRDGTYLDLVRASVEATAGRGEVLVGVGDTSLARTLDRIRAVESLAIDGVVVLTPWLWKYPQAELVGYYRALADASRRPVHLYDLPGLTGVKLDLATILAAAEHPNIRGVKCSFSWDETRQVLDRAGDRLRVIPAQPHLVDMLIRCGVRDNLDGIYGVAPEWTMAIVRAAEAGDWETAAAVQRRLSELHHLLTSSYPLFPACTVILNARGVAGHVVPRPRRPLDARTAAALLAEPLVRHLLADVTS